MLATSLPFVQIADCIARQKGNREAISALKEGAQQKKLWLQRPGGVYLRLPSEQCAKLLLRGGRIHACLCSHPHCRCKATACV
jgi:hypothetical protein